MEQAPKTSSTAKKHSYNDVDDDDPLKDFEPLTDALVYAWQNNSLEVMLTSDLTRIRVLLKESFHGIPVEGMSKQKKQKKIDRSHPHYHLAVGMMLGIRECVGGIDGLREAELEEQDLRVNQECRRNRKYSFPQGYEFKAYAPLVFARIRSQMEIDKQLFLHSICGNFSFLEFLSNAKSGSFFFFSHDKRYLIKTMTPTECHFLQSILPRYYNYLQHNPHTFLTKYYGLYRLQSGSQQIYFSIMGSVLDTTRDIHKTFDLKGSTLGRTAKPKESVLKDLDILSEGRKLRVEESVQQHVHAQLRRDATLMARLGIMDYSFLLGISERSSDEAEEVKQESSIYHEHEEEEDEVMAVRRETESPKQEDEFVNWDSLEYKPTVEESSVNTSLAGESEAQSVISTASSWGQSDGPCPYSTRTDHGIDSSDRKEIYYGGIIDILQLYNTRKWGETVVKKVSGNSEQEISCVDPETYANRFVKFISNLTETPEKK
jgi:1-phosphatidylinositol-4-phosphate 5-kinase